MRRAGRLEGFEGSGAIELLERLERFSVGLNGVSAVERFEPLEWLFLREGRRFLREIDAAER